METSKQKTSIEIVETIIFNLKCYCVNKLVDVSEDVDNFTKVLNDLKDYESLKKEHEQTLINNGELCVKVTKLEEKNKDLNEYLVSAQNGNRGYSKKVIELEKENKSLKERLLKRDFVLGFGE